MFNLEINFSVPFERDALGLTVGTDQLMTLDDDEGEIEREGARTFSLHFFVP